MPESLTPIVVALIALVGTLVAAAFAHRRWRAEHSTPYATQRRETYREAWEKAESLNLDLRTGEVDPEQYRRRLTDLNRFMLAGGPYLDEEDRVLIREYVQAVGDLLTLLERPDATDAQVPMGQTDAIPQEVLVRVKELGAAQARAADLRSRVIARIQAVIGSR